MQPVRKVLSATHFKPVQPDPDSAIIKWIPCSPGDQDAVEKNWNQVESEELQEPPLRFVDFVKSLESVRPTVSQEDIKRHDEWTKESGTLSARGSCVLLLWLMGMIPQGPMVHDHKGPWRGCNRRYHIFYIWFRGFLDTSHLAMRSCT